jgi:hypothetical protein
MLACDEEMSKNLYKFFNFVQPDHHPKFNQEFQIDFEMENIHLCYVNHLKVSDESFFDMMLKGLSRRQVSALSISSTKLLRTERVERSIFSSGALHHF